MENNPEIELLQKVKRVDIPPFLLTRIQAKVQKSKDELIPLSWSMGMAMGLMVLLLLNSDAYQNQLKNVRDAREIISTTMNLNTSNQLYYD